MDPIKTLVHEFGQELDRCRTEEDIYQVLLRGFETNGNTSFENAVINCRRNPPSFFQRVWLGIQLNSLLGIKHGIVLGGHPQNTTAGYTNFHGDPRISDMTNNFMRSL